MGYDLLILGGGPAGFRAAERAGHFGLKTALFEGNALGGVCLNEGCIPTKTMLYSAKLYDYNLIRCERITQSTIQTIRAMFLLQQVLVDTYSEVWR